MFERQLLGAVNVIKPTEPLSDEVVDDLYVEFEKISETGMSNVVVDLSETPLATGAGVEALLDGLDHFVARGGNLKLATPGAIVSDLLRVTKIDAQFEVFDSVSKAVGSFVR